MSVVPSYPELEPYLERLARAVAAHEDAEVALAAASRRLVAGSGSTTAVRAMARCEVLERRARLHVELARRALRGARSTVLDDQRRVPAAFRRHRNGTGNGVPPVEVLGSRVERARDRAAS